jgi:hypothetical protein
MFSNFGQMPDQKSFHPSCACTLVLAELRGAEARSRGVIEAARDAWLEAYYWQRAEQVLSDSRPLFDDLLQITQSMYAVGRSAQSDVLSATLLTLIVIPALFLLWRQHQDLD